jgi:hypothetical protein
MHEHETVAALIDRIVAGARVPTRTAREQLRRELWTHFEETGASPEAVHDALHRFGAEPMVTESLRRIYRSDRVFLNLAKIATSILVSLGAALLIQALVNLRVEAQAEVWRLAPGFPHAVGLSVAMVLALVTAREGLRPPLHWSRAGLAIGAYAAVGAIVQLMFANGTGAFVTAAVLVVLGHLCSKLELSPARLVLTFGVFAVAEYAMHFTLRVGFGPSRAVAASAVLVAVWSTTVLILGWVDQAFTNVDPPSGG